MFVVYLMYQGVYPEATLVLSTSESCPCLFNIGCQFCWPLMTIMAAGMDQYCQPSICICALTAMLEFQSAIFFFKTWPSTFKTYNLKTRKIAKKVWPA